MAGCLSVERKKCPERRNFPPLRFKKLDDPSRLKIFWLLCHCEECVINLSSLMEMSSPAVSHHLKVLRSAGLIVSRREGKEVYYKAADTAQCRTLHETIERIMEISCPK